MIAEYVLFDVPGSMSRAEVVAVDNALQETIEEAP